MGVERSLLNEKRRSGDAGKNSDSAGEVKFDDGGEEVEEWYQLEPIAKESPEIWLGELDLDDKRGEQTGKLRPRTKPIMKPICEKNAGVPIIRGKPFVRPAGGSSKEELWRTKQKLGKVLEQVKWKEGDNLLVPENRAASRRLDDAKAKFNKGETAMFQPSGTGGEAQGSEVVDWAARVSDETKLMGCRVEERDFNVKQGDALVEQGREFDVAVNCYENALKLDPDNKDIKSKIEIAKGDLAVMLNHYAKALKFYDRALEYDPGGVVALTKKCDIWFNRYSREGRAAIDLEAFEKCVVELAKSGSSIELAPTLKRYARSLDDLVAAAPNDIRLWEAKHRVCDVLGDEAGMHEVLNNLIRLEAKSDPKKRQRLKVYVEENPDDPEFKSLSKFLLAAYGDEEPEKQAKHLLELMVLEPKNKLRDELFMGLCKDDKKIFVRRLYSAGRACFDQGKHEAALVYFDKVARQSLGHEGAIRYKMKIHGALEEFAEAAHCCNWLAALEPGNFEKYRHWKEKGAKFYAAAIKSDSKNEVSRVALARVYFELKKFMDAAEEYEALSVWDGRYLFDAAECYNWEIQARPDAVEAWKKLLGTYQKLGGLESKLACCEKLAELESETEEWQNELMDNFEKWIKLTDVEKSAGLVRKIGDEFCLREDYELALNCYRKLMERDAGDEDAWSKAAAAHIGLGELAEAAKCYVMCATIAEKEGHTEDIARYYERAIKLEPDNVEAHKRLESCYKDLKKYLRAAGQCEKLAELEVDKEMEWWTNAKNYYSSVVKKICNAVEAGKMSKEHSSVKNYLVKAWEGLSAAYRKFGTAKAELKCYDALADLDEGNWEKYYEETVRVCEAELEKNEDDTNFMFALGVAHWQSGRSDSALKCFEKILGNGAARGGTHYELTLEYCAELCEEKKYFKDAMKYYRDLIEVALGRAENEGWFDRFEFCADGLKKEAEAEGNATLFESLASAHLELALAVRRNGKDRKAAEWFEAAENHYAAAIELKPKNIDYRLGLNKVCLLKKDFGKAKWCLEETLKINEESVVVWEKLAVLYETHLKDYLAAAKSCKRLIELDSADKVQSHCKRLIGCGVKVLGRKGVGREARVWVYKNMADAYQNIGSVAKAIGCLEKLVGADSENAERWNQKIVTLGARDSNDAEVISAVAFAYSGLDEYAASMERFCKLAEMEPEKGWDEDVLTCFDKLSDVEKRDAARLEKVARAHINLGHGREAINYSNQIIERLPENVNAWECRAAAYRLIGNLVEERNCYVELRGLSPERDSYYLERSKECCARLDAQAGLSRRDRRRFHKRQNSLVGKGAQR